MKIENSLSWVILILIILTILQFVGTFNMFNKCFEYKVDFIEDRDSYLQFRKLGYEGWEIEGSRRASNSDKLYGYELILKKKISCN